MKNTQTGLFDDEIIKNALSILEQPIAYDANTPCPTSPNASKDHFKLQLREYEHEVFACLFLDNRHRIVAFEEMFRGTSDGASMCPREAVKAALWHDAAAVIFAHNHPCGVAEPSKADKAIQSA